MKRILRTLAIPTGLLFSTALPAPAVPVTFQVSLEYQITNATPTFVQGFDTVEVRGSFNGWSDGFMLVNIPGTTSYTNTLDITSPAPGGTVEYKFHTYGSSGDFWEALPGYIYTNSGNRAFVLAGSAQSLPPAYFNDQWGGTVLLTVQVDMGPQLQVGNFVPDSDTVEVRGSWDTFSSGVTLTNDPASANTNLYTMTFAIGSPAPGGLAAYKFHTYGTHDRWEPDPNRLVLVSSPETRVPSAYFSNQGPGDLLQADTQVTFSVNMTNAVGTDAVTFDPSTCQVYLNGDFLGWWSWGPSPPTQYQLQPVGLSQIYSLVLLIPKGTPVAMNYKYGINGADDEAPFLANHVRYLRATGTQVLPLDTFDVMTVEASFGNLRVAPASGGHIPVSWLGRPGVHLQTTTNLNIGTWSDDLATDGLSATNYPATAPRTFFRLVEP